MPTSIFLIRHAAYEHLPSPAGDAASDFGLSQEGRMQAELLAARLRASGEIKPDAFFSSTLPRAVQTAAYLAPVFGLSAVALGDLCEWESGNDALGEAAFKSAWKGLAVNARRTHRFLPGAETIEEFSHRVQKCLAKIVEAHEGKTATLVVHGGVIEAAFAYFLEHGIGPYAGGYPAAGHTSLTLWRSSERGEEWVQEFGNDTFHLRGATRPPVGHFTNTAT